MQNNLLQALNSSNLVYFKWWEPVSHAKILGLLDEHYLMINKK